MTPMDAESATRLERLMHLRAEQEAALADDVPAREFAALSREYRATLAEIAELEPTTREGDGVDEIAKRRVARRAVPTKGAARAKRSG